MVHPIATTSQSEELPYFQHLWRLLLAPETDLASKLEQLFAEETARFELDCAFLSRIDRDDGTQHFELVHSPHGEIREDLTVPLSETYCRKTIVAPEGTMAVSDATAEGWGDDPAYDRFDIGSYVGTTVTTGDDLYGTLCFTDTAPRELPLTDEEVALVEMYGQWATYELNQYTAPPNRDPTGGELEEHDLLLSPELDVMMDALGTHARRVILLTLLEVPAATSSDLRDRWGDAELSEIELHHAHLPKLEQAGYIEWDPDSATLSRGPEFSDIEPLLRLLNEYTGAGS